MKIHRLNTILEKSSNRKYRKNFTKYLSSLDFKEYKILFGFYLKVLTRLMIRYNSMEKKAFSKKSFKNILLNYKYSKFIKLFLDGNKVFFDRYNDELKTTNTKTINLLLDIEKTKNSLQNLHTSWLIWSNSLLKIDDVSKENIRYFNILLISIIHNNKQYERLVNELDDMTKKYKNLLP